VPFDDLIQRSDHTYGGQREIGFNAQPLTVEAIEALLPGNLAEDQLNIQPI
jgi:hypothetical protein